jgi:hypothetical protein
MAQARGAGPDLAGSGQAKPFFGACLGLYFGHFVSLDFLDDGFQRLGMPLQPK